MKARLDGTEAKMRAEALEKEKSSQP